MQILSAQQVDEFVATGCTVLRGAFPSATAAACVEHLWTRIEPDGDDRSTWTQPLVHLREVYSDPPFRDAYTPALLSALDDLLGEDRYPVHYGLGWWPIAFPGFDTPPWTPPTTGWHVDGQHFHHHVDAAEQGLLPLFLLTDIAPGGGGTCVDLGSHRVATRLLAAAEPDGLSCQELAQAMTAQPRRQVVEVTGQAGDVALLHPFMLHARGPNTGGGVRVICNPCIRLHERMRLDGAAPSPVERAIVEALAEGAGPR